MQAPTSCVILQCNFLSSRTRPPVQTGEASNQFLPAYTRKLNTTQISEAASESTNSRLTSKASSCGTKLSCATPMQTMTLELCKTLTSVPELKNQLKHLERRQKIRLLSLGVDDRAWSSLVAKFQSERTRWLTHCSCASYTQRSKDYLPFQT